MTRSQDIPPQELAEAVTAGDRIALARAITLIESSRPADKKKAQALLQTLLPQTGNAIRVGITGVPGVGKSTLIERLGRNLTSAGHKVAVLAIDPTSQRTGGSILADKTRMPELAADESAFIRPSPSAGTLGGVADRTRETMLLCEAAGFDVIIVETVGIGQSETAVAGMVDFFLVLMLPGAGDEIQGIKKGVLEIADMIAVNKADGDNANRAKLAAAEYIAAFHILTPASPNWRPPVITVSGKENIGLDDLWAKIMAHRKTLKGTGEFDEKRRSQQVGWMWTLIEDRLSRRVRESEATREQIKEIEAEVRAGTLDPAAAAERTLALAGIG